MRKVADIRVTHSLNREEWIIEAKGQIPAGNEHAAFKEGLGQIVMARNRRLPHFLYALAMPKVHPFPQETAQIDARDLLYLRLHWIWVTRRQAAPHTVFEVQIV